LPTDSTDEPKKRGGPGSLPRNNEPWSGCAGPICCVTGPYGDGGRRPFGGLTAPTFHPLVRRLESLRPRPAHPAARKDHTARPDVHFPGAAKIVLVQDNLNTPKPASLYEAFPAAEARRLVARGCGAGSLRIQCDAATSH